VLRVVGWHLVHSARPSMNAAIGAAVCEALAAIKPLILDGTKGAPVVITELDKSIMKRQSAVRLAEAFTKWTTELYTSCETINVVTVSSSSTIRNALHHLAVHSHFKHINISFLESRPRCEGASLAASLLDLLQSDSNVRSRISITLAPDSHLPLLLSATSSSSPSPQSSEAQVTITSSATILLLGADRISPHGAVLNKTLSLSAAMLAKTIGPQSTKVVVLAETDKIAGAVDLELFRLGSKFQWARERSVKKEMAQYGGEEGGTEEVLGSWEMSGVKAGDVRALRQALSHETEREAAQEGGGGRVDVIVRNETFEWVPPEWLDVYVTEQGVLGKEEIGKVALARTESEAEIFRDLYA
jgi:translation initiation factor 2B subunit (eIF-2B alpha/beta/delta family)